MRKKAEAKKPKAEIARFTQKAISEKVLEKLRGLKLHVT